MAHAFRKSHDPAACVGDFINGMKFEDAAHELELDWESVEANEPGTLEAKGPSVLLTTLHSPTN